MQKKCSGCKIPKDLDDFHRDSNNADKRHYFCKECMKKLKKEWLKKKNDGIIEAF
jgi:hypothetical protein